MATRSGRFLSLFALGAILLSGCNGLPWNLDQSGLHAPPAHSLDGNQADSSDDFSMSALAKDLDHLERHIDWFGSVTAKVPDVWGQARLTQYRDEFEKTMGPEINNFTASINGSLSRSDQAFFANATALSFAVQPPAPIIGSNRSDKNAAPQLVPQSQTVSSVTTDPVTKAQTTTNTTLGPAGSPAAPTPVKPIDLGDPASLVSTNEQVITRNGVTVSRPAFATGTISLEPTEYLAQKKRYIDFLNQLRRENEGDDTADSPGYSLNLMRVPVSILPGKRTDVGFGAEITMTLTPVLGDDLLQTTFRNLVTNDILKQLGLPLTQLMDNGPSQDVLKPETRELIIKAILTSPIDSILREPHSSPEQQLRKLSAYLLPLPSKDKNRILETCKEAGTDQYSRMKNISDGTIAQILAINAALSLDNDKTKWRQRLGELFQHWSSDQVSQLNRFATNLSSFEKTNLEQIIDVGINEAALNIAAARSKVIKQIQDENQKWLGLIETKSIIARYASTNKRPSALSNSLSNAQPTDSASIMNYLDTLPRTLNPDTTAKLNSICPISLDPTGNNTNSLPRPVNLQDPSFRLAALNVTLKRPGFGFSPGLTNRIGFPTSQLVDIYGLLECVTIAQGANEALRSQINRQGYAHLPDVQGYLYEETLASYRLLANQECQVLWSRFCTPELVSAIRTRKIETLLEMRSNFRSILQSITLSTNANREKHPYLEEGEFTVTAALAWCIIVDAALLTDRLILDMKEAASAKGRSLLDCSQWCEYYLPEPPNQCREAFKEYVKLRWPIHIFALDPYVQEQNIADSLSTRRETQLALAIAFTNGQMNARQLTRFTRRLEAEYETIDLNRTQVGFSHGENVFGWRFYPRYQTPDTASNLTVLFRDNLIGGPNRNQILRQRRLEPGMRECVAIVMMPSFVPFVNVDAISNWFPIANPKHKVLDNTQALKLSRTVQIIKNESCAVSDAGKYRPGDLERLVRRAEQLETRLPSQTLISPVPILNTYGGFEMFANGTSDFAPELFGWYGAPGIDPDNDTTTLFLVGDHFSPIRSHVIVGNEVVGNTATIPQAQVLLSRQVMQVTFAKGAYQVPQANGAGEVRVHVATPYGVTQELAIPVVSRKPAPKPGISVAGTKLTIQYAQKPQQASQTKSDDGSTSDKTAPAAGTATAQGTQTPKAQYVATGVDSSLKLKWVYLDPTATTATNFQVQFVFTIPGTGGQPDTVLAVPCQCGATATANATPSTDPLTPSSGGDLTIAADQLQRIAADLFNQQAIQTLATSGTLASGLTTTKIVVTALGADGKPGRSVLTNDQLSVVFKLGTYCPGTELKPETCPPTIKASIKPEKITASFKVEKVPSTPVVPAPIPPKPIPAAHKFAPAPGAVEVVPSPSDPMASNPDTTDQSKDDTKYQYVDKANEKLTVDQDLVVTLGVEDTLNSTKITSYGVVLVFERGGNIYRVPAKVGSYTLSGGKVTIAKDALATIIAELVNMIQGKGFTVAANPFDCVMITTRIEIVPNPSASPTTPNAPAGQPANQPLSLPSSTTSNQLTVVFKVSGLPAKPAQSGGAGAGMGNHN